MLHRLVKGARTIFPPRIPGIKLASQTLVANLPGVTILSCRDGKSSISVEFKIEPGNEIAAIENLLRVLDANSDLSLSDPRQDVEGAMSFRRLDGRLQRMSGGHGWTSRWETVEFEVAVRAALEVVKFNYGDNVHNHGYFMQYKPGMCPWNGAPARTPLVKP
jgi:hypothetical protein